MRGLRVGSHLCKTLLHHVQTGFGRPSRILPKDLSLGKGGGGVDLNLTSPSAEVKKCKEPYLHSLMCVCVLFF